MFWRDRQGIALAAMVIQTWLPVPFKYAVTGLESLRKRACAVIAAKMSLKI